MSPGVLTKRGRAGGYKTWLDEAATSERLGLLHVNGPHWPPPPRHQAQSLQSHGVNQLMPPSNIRSVCFLLSCLLRYFAALFDVCLLIFG